MNIERSVVSLATAKRLKAAGFPQKTHFAWHEPASKPGYDGILPLGHYELTDIPQVNDVAAPTPQEIADQLPEDLVINVARNLAKEYNAWFGSPPIYPLKVSIAPTMAEVLASLWLRIQGEADGR
jgi:hypothetical protein